MVKYVKFAEGTTSITCSDPDTNGNTYYHAILLPKAEEVILPKSLTSTSKNLFVYAYNGGESSIYNKSVCGVIKKLTAPCGVSGLCTYYKSTYYNRNTLTYSSTEATAPLEELVLIKGDNSNIVTSVYSSKNTLIKLTISNGITSIYNNAIADCSKLVSVTIPNTIISIGKYAFQNCYSLANIYFKGTSEEWDNISKGTDWNSSMGSNVSGGTQIHYEYVPE